MYETKRLIIEEVNHKHNAKISTILLSVSNTFLMTHLLDDNNNDPMELFHFMFQSFKTKPLLFLVLRYMALALG